MKNKIKFFMKRVLISICTATLVLSTTSCSLSKTDQQSMSNQVETRTDGLKEIAFENDIEYLSVKGIQLPDLAPNSTMLEGEVASEQLLTRLMAAEMMVSAYEDTCGEIQTTQTLKPKDTDDINAWKSNEFFFWTESPNFEPEKTGNWDDWDFMSTINYDSQLRLGLKLDEAKPPYGAVVAALASLLRDYEGLKQNPIEEKIVLNERPYNWHVNQQETGEYSVVNCMPSCVEMAMRYQGLSDVPSAEKLRMDNPLNGLGWNDVPAENVMLQYGLNFTDSSDIALDKMLDLLDKGNVLYLMYRELSSQEGHAVIIKGYRKLGSSVNFIISDPDHNMVGPFGYLEYTKDAQIMLSDIERHIPRYFIIPKGE